MLLALTPPLVSMTRRVSMACLSPLLRWFYAHSIRGVLLGVMLWWWLSHKVKTSTRKLRYIRFKPAARKVEASNIHHVAYEKCAFTLTCDAKATEEAKGSPLSFCVQLKQRTAEKAAWPPYLTCWEWLGCQLGLRLCMIMAQVRGPSVAITNGPRPHQEMDLLFRTLRETGFVRTADPTGTCHSTASLTLRLTLTLTLTLR